MRWLREIFVLAVAVSLAVAQSPKLLICSDSTTANYASGDLQGWGYYIGGFLTIPVKNLARNGRSTRLFIQDGEWKTLLSQTSPGDFVVIEMGHNDEADPRKGDKYADRGTLPGTDQAMTAKVQTSKGTEQVYSFGHYLRSMIQDVKAKGAVPVISGMVPRNYWQNGKLQQTWKFTEYAREVAKELQVEFLDHTKYSVNRLNALGQTKSKALFPNDNTHTGPKGAEVNAETFVEAIECGRSALLKYLNSKGKGIKAPC